MLAGAEEAVDDTVNAKGSAAAEADAQLRKLMPPREIRPPFRQNLACVTRY